MKLPETIKVCGLTYRIEFPYHFKERGDICGQHDGQMQVIRIDDLDSYDHSLRPDSSILVTFIHELLHAVDYVSGRRIFEGDEGEGIVKCFSQIIYQILNDNGFLEVKATIEGPLLSKFKG